MEDKDIVITSAFRTPIGSYMGSLSTVKATELGTEIIKRMPLKFWWKIFVANFGNKIDKL